MTRFSRLNDSEINERLLKLLGYGSIGDDLFCFGLIKEHGIDLTRHPDGMWCADYSNDRVMFASLNSNLNRSICETYLKMKENENEHRNI